MNNNFKQLILITTRNQYLFIVDIETYKCTKMQTPYGMRLTWELNSEATDEHGQPTDGMIFVVHLKDNQKVNLLQYNHYNLIWVNKNWVPYLSIYWVAAFKPIFVKVKNKKRWSQVMYMSYILDYYMKQEDGRWIQSIKFY